MSKNIWHITNKNKDNTDIPEEENMVVLDGVMGYSCLWYGGENPEPIFWENVKRWCYLDELILESERTRKALDVARNGLEYIFGYEGVPEYVVKHIRQVLDQIKNETAPEQKD